MTKVEDITMNKHNHTGLDESVSVASNTMQAVNTGKAISAAAKGAAAGGPYGACLLYTSDAADD